MTTMTLTSTEHRNRLKALRTAADDPTDPLFEDALAVLGRFEDLRARGGFDDETALQKAIEERRHHDETAGA